MLGSFFIDQGSFSATEFEDSRDSVAIAALTVLVLVTAVAVFAVAMWSARLIVPRGISAGHAAQVALRFRDCTIATGLISNVDFTRAVAKLQDEEMSQLEAATRTIVAVFLGLQPHSNLLRQRLMPGVPFAIWVPKDTTMHALEEVVSGRAHETAMQNATERLALMALSNKIREQTVSNSALEGRLRQHPPDEQGQSVSPELSNRSDRSARLSFRSETVEKLSRAMSLRSDLSVGSLAGKVKSLMEGWSEDQCKAVFQMMDTSGDGNIGIEEFTAAVVACAPKLDTSQMDRCRQLCDAVKSESEAVQAGGEWNEECDDIY